MLYTYLRLSDQESRALIRIAGVSITPTIDTANLLRLTQLRVVPFPTLLTANLTPTELF